MKEKKKKFADNKSVLVWKDKREETILPKMSVIWSVD